LYPVTTQTIANLAFTNDDSDCPSITYTITDDSSDPLDSNVFTLSPAVNPTLITINNINTPSYINTYTIRVRATNIYYTLIRKFQVTIEHECQ
jgi:hypothetical protein